MSQQDDQVMYDLMRKGDIIGWDLLFRKYYKPKYYQPYLSAYTLLAAADKADIWGDAMEALFFLIRTGKFIRQKEGKDFLLPGIIHIARWKANDRLRMKNLPLVPITEKEDALISDDVIETARWEEVDMLLIRICVEHLNDTRRNIILLKYFSEQPLQANCTDAQLSALLEGIGYHLSTAHVGTDRRRAEEQVLKWYKQLSKKIVESDLKKTDLDTFMTVNVHFPTDELWNILYKSEKSNGTQNVALYLEKQQTSVTHYEAPRRWLYASTASQWLEKMRNATPYDVFEEKLLQWVRTAKKYFIPKR